MTYGKLLAAKRFFTNFNIELYLKVLEAKDLKESIQLKEKVKDKIKKHLNIRSSYKPNLKIINIK